MSDPFKIDGPAVISFSGGRTSGYMLWRILQAHGGKLPDDVKVIFANTGKEMPETLDFVRDCSIQWNVYIAWVEYRYLSGHHTYQHVDYESASRNGEPYEDVIKHRRMLPNPRSRFCTVELKVRTMHRYIKDVLGFKEWTSYVGIRADEPYRVARLGNHDYGNQEDRKAPLAEAGISAKDVGDFWKAQSFDLRLPNINGVTKHGNCDLCFLKGGDQLLALIREEPQRALWWMKMETYSESTFVERNSGGAFGFRIDRPSYASMYRIATQHGELFPFDDEPLQDCMCTD